LHDVGMAKLQQCLHLSQSQAALETGGTTLDDLDRYSLHLNGVLGEIDVSECALANFTDQPILLHFEMFSNG